MSYVNETGVIDGAYKGPDSKTRKRWNMTRYPKGSFVPVKYWEIDGRLRCIRDYDLIATMTETEKKHVV